MTELEFASKIASIGGRAYIVGGWVRDKLMGNEPHDTDYVICGVCRADFQKIFAEAIVIGNSFPVFSLLISGKRCEVAFARKERKAGIGYKGFEVLFDPSVTIEDDLYRRDTTVNSMAMDILSGEILDLYGGAKDLKDRILRPVSIHFSEDPVRALRAARQGAQHGFQISPELCLAMKKCRNELFKEPQERIFAELKKALTTVKPSLFFNILQESNLLDVVFPEIYRLIGKTQPAEYHPEGDAYAHTMIVIDKVAADTSNPIAVFCALVHDIGKGSTPETMLPHHYDHEKRGIEVLAQWNNRCTMPKEWIKCAKFVIKEHMRAPLLKKPSKISQLIMGVSKLSYIISGEEFCSIIEADHHSLPIYLRGYNSLLEQLQIISGSDVPQVFKGPDIGKWLDNARTKQCYIWLRKNE